MNTRKVPISQIKFYENNAKYHPGKQIESIVQSIRQFGFRQPLVFDKNNIIVAGLTRLQTAISMGLHDVPAEMAEDLTEEQINRWRKFTGKQAIIESTQQTFDEVSYG